MPGSIVEAFIANAARAPAKICLTFEGESISYEQLRDEVRKLQGWEARARELERRLADLSIVARVVDEPGFEFITGRVIADAKGPFARSVLLNAGREERTLGSSAQRAEHGAARVETAQYVGVHFGKLVDYFEKIHDNE